MSEGLRMKKFVSMFLLAKINRICSMTLLTIGPISLVFQKTISRAIIYRKLRQENPKGLPKNLATDY